MKSLVQHIYERRHVNNSVILLSNHIYDKLKELVNKPANNPKFNNETLLYELKLSGPEFLHALINFAVESREE